MKGFIEKNTWLGLEDFYDALSQALISEYNIPPAKAKRRTRKSAGHAGQILPNMQTSLPTKQIKKDEAQLVKKSQMFGNGMNQNENIKENSGKVNSRRQERLSWVVIFLLITLIFFNVILYYKLWKLEEHDTHTLIR